MLQVEKDIIEDFSILEDPMMRYEYIIDLGKELEPIDEKDRVDANLVKGCQSKVWLVSDLEEGKIKFKADSNTVITKGIIALLVRALSGQKPEDVINAELKFIDEIELRSHLSEQRSNGLNAMIQKMKSFAEAVKNA